MSEEPGSLTLRYLRRLDDKMDSLQTDIADLASEVRGIKSNTAGFMQNELAQAGAQDGAQDGAIAGLKKRLDRIERRLDLNEEAP
jgi:hypothetical protein